MRQAALAHLERSLAEMRDDPDPDDASAYGLAYAQGAALAYERIGALSSDEAARWIARLTQDPAEDGTALLSEGARVAGLGYLEQLVARVPPHRRAPEPGDDAVRAECASAIEALYTVGALDDREVVEWSSRRLHAEAPWLDDPTPPEGGFGVITIPPETEEEAAEDAAAEEAWAARPNAAFVRRVAVGSRDRHAGLAIVAVAVHEDATSVHFHFLGDSVPAETRGRKKLDPFAAVDALIPPTLRDNRGHRYDPVDDHPASASSSSGISSGERLHVVTGTWIYTPAAPEPATTFLVEQSGNRWTLATPSASPL